MHVQAPAIGSAIESLDREIIGRLLRRQQCGWRHIDVGRLSTHACFGLKFDYNLIRAIESDKHGC